MIYKCQIFATKPLTAWVILKWSLLRGCCIWYINKTFMKFSFVGFFDTIYAFPLYVYWIFVNESPTVEWYFFPNDFTLSWHAPSGAPACSPWCNITQIVVKKNQAKSTFSRDEISELVFSLQRGDERKSTPTVKNLNFEESCFVPNAFLL